MNLRDLQYLTAVADHLHFGQAAEACHVSQPTLSMQIKKLEDLLGVQVFERTNKNVLVTQMGEEIIERARRTLQEAEGLYAPYLLPLFVQSIREHLPRITLQLVEEKSPELIRLTEHGQMDCALLAMDMDLPHLESCKLFVEPFRLAVPAQHRLAKRKQVKLSDMEDETLLLLDDGHCLRDQALEICETIGIGESRSFRATSLETLRHMVAAGNAVTLMPELAVRQNDPHVSYIPFSPPAPSRTIGLYWRKASARSVLYRKLAEIITQAVKR
jgi:LysR family hydrogen peroxide-inducible transcriptional activator